MKGTIKGTVHFVGECKAFGQKGFRKRTVVLESVNGRYSSFYPIDFTGELAEDSGRLSVGDEVEVEGYLNGRKWQRDANSEPQYFLGFEGKSFTGGKAVQEPTETPTFDPSYDDSSDIPF